jgi:hypothetical protein
VVGTRPSQHCLGSRPIGRGAFGPIAAMVGASPLQCSEATTTIPIVAAAMGDPLSDGLVASLARPGGNITGSTFLGPELVPKRLELLKEALPKASKVAEQSHQTSDALVLWGGVVPCRVVPNPLQMERLQTKCSEPCCCGSLRLLCSKGFSERTFYERWPVPTG